MIRELEDWVIRVAGYQAIRTAGYQGGGYQDSRVSGL